MVCDRGVSRVLYPSRCAHWWCWRLQAGAKYRTSDCNCLFATKKTAPSCFMTQRSAWLSKPNFFDARRSTQCVLAGSSPHQLSTHSKLVDSHSLNRSIIFVQGLVGEPKKTWTAKMPQLYGPRRHYHPRSQRSHSHLRIRCIHDRLTNYGLSSML